MSRKPRYLPNGATVEVTCRTLHSSFLLRPSTLVNNIIHEVLARAQEQFEVEVHLHCFMANHFHALCTPKDQRELSGFMAYVLAEAS